MNLFRNIFLYVILFGLNNIAICQELVSKDEFFTQAYQEIMDMLEDNKEKNFKRAVFVLENAFLENRLSYVEFQSKIDAVESRLDTFIKDKGIQNNPLAVQYAIFTYMTEKSKYNDQTIFGYNFDDFEGRKDHTSTFLTTIIDTKIGNCRSLPFFFKIMSDEMQSESFLALAPNHIYIVHKDGKGGWTNVELTNGTFPRDEWLMSQMYVSLDAIRKGTYMTPLTPQQEIAQCLFDLGIAYQAKYGADAFVLQCMDKVITYFPECVTAKMVKAQYYGKEYRKAVQLGDQSTVSVTIDILETLYAQIDAQGYKDMPKEMYETWLKNVEEQKTQTTSKKN